MPTGHVAGTISDGILTGAKTEGIDDLLIGQDGVGVLDVRVFGSLPDGRVVARTVKGFAGDPATIRPARFSPSRYVRRTAHPPSAVDRENQQAPARGPPPPRGS